MSDGNGRAWKGSSSQIRPHGIGEWGGGGPRPHRLAGEYNARREMGERL